MPVKPIKRGCPTSPSKYKTVAGSKLLRHGLCYYYCFPHSVWKVPGRSIRSYVCAPK